MKRSLPSALAILSSLGALLLVLFFDSPVTVYLAGLAPNSSAAAFLAKYWWFLLLAGVMLHVLWFAATVACNRALSTASRVLWPAAMLLLGPGVMLAYWWSHREQ